MPALTPTDPAAFALEEMYVEDPEGFTEEFGGDRGTATRRFMCDWEQRFAAMAYFVGYAATYVSGGTTYLSRLMPHRHPVAYEWAATKVKIVGHRWVGVEYLTPGDAYPVVAPPPPPPTYAWSAGTINKYRRAILDVTYEHVPFNLVDDADISVEADRYVAPADGLGRSSTEYLTLPGSVMTYQASGGGAPSNVPIPYPVGRPQSTEDVVYNWLRLPENAYGPGTTLHTRIYGDGTSSNWGFVGTVNMSAVLGRPAGTMLYLGPEPRLKRSPTGVGWEWDITHKWQFKATLHNNLLYVKNGSARGYYQARAAGSYQAPGAITDGRCLFDERDHNLLFQVG